MISYFFHIRVFYMSMCTYELVGLHAFGDAAIFALVLFLTIISIAHSQVRRHARGSHAQRHVDGRGRLRRSAGLSQQVPRVQVQRLLRLGRVVRRCARPPAALPRLCFALLCGRIDKHMSLSAPLPRPPWSARPQNDAMKSTMRYQTNYAPLAR
jgi:hypothetical protein